MALALLCSGNQPLVGNAVCKRVCSVSSAQRPQVVQPGRAARNLQAAGLDTARTTCPVLPTEDFIGNVSLRSKPGRYGEIVDQYASLNHVGDNSMKPYAIIEAAGDEDIMLALTWARRNKLAVAVRTGGHQYSGASSTSDCNIQLDVSNTYKGFKWQDEDTVEVGVSHSVMELNDKLREHNRFVPHGQCAHVHVGGHAQTGGWGMLGRAFGLFGDYISAIRVITADGPNGSSLPPRWIERNTQDEQQFQLFWAVLGGSPGNFAVLTHIRLSVENGDHYPKARGVKLMGLYAPEAMKHLLQIKAAMAADPNLPADFDMCITVMSGPGIVPEKARDILSVGGPQGSSTEPGVHPEEFKATGSLQHEKSILERFELGTRESWHKFLQSDHGLQGLERLVNELPADFEGLVKPDDLIGLEVKLGPEGRFLVLPVIIVFAQWGNLGGHDQDDSHAIDWLQSVKGAKPFWLAEEEFVPPIPKSRGDHAPLDPATTHHGMPLMTSKWVFPIRKEYDLPYDKRTYVTNATNLDTSGWVDFTLDQINCLVRSWIMGFSGLRIAVQVQHFGGNQSHFRTKASDDKTSYSWRDTTMMLTMDAFYFSYPLARELAARWQQVNDDGFKGPKGTFSPSQDRRLFWASYEAQGTDELDLGKYWHFYHEDEDKWNKLRDIKRRVDPDEVLSPNPFSVPPPSDLKLWVGPD